MPENGKITSPEQLNSYIRVTSPGAWIILASALAFLLGLFVWIFSGELTITNPAGSSQTIKPITFLLK
ncbi:MAG: hypothetical protein IJS28_11255 [Synergistaceae bacterium]|nr:hypothetical protein [Synergistaceae bacterium]